MILITFYYCVRSATWRTKILVTGEVSGAQITEIPKRYIQVFVLMSILYGERILIPFPKRLKSSWDLRVRKEMSGIKFSFFALGKFGLLLYLHMICAQYMNLASFIYLSDLDWFVYRVVKEHEVSLWHPAFINMFLHSSSFSLGLWRSDACMYMF